MVKPPNWIAAGITSTRENSCELVCRSEELSKSSCKSLSEISSEILKGLYTSVKLSASISSIFHQAVGQVIEEKKQTCRLSRIQ